jgi:hypothetical protein
MPMLVYPSMLRLLEFPQRLARASRVVLRQQVSLRAVEECIQQVQLVK